MPSVNNQNKEGGEPSPEPPGAGFSRQFAMAMELPFIIVSAIIVGGLAGFFLDRWLHTRPFLMLILGFLGFFGGLRDVLRRLDRHN
jgi:F0F1-type ATP synthase assembly protein I